MRLDANRPLAPATVEAMQDFFEPPDPREVEDSALLAVALGVADAPTRLAVARAIVASPAVRARLLLVRASVSGPLAAPTPEGEEEADLARLSAFAAPFDDAAAAALDPVRYGEGGRLRRLVEGGWLEATDEPSGTVYRLPERFRRGAAFEGEVAERVVRHFLARAQWIDRSLAEGQWREAGALLRRILPDLRAAWRLADARDDAETVREFVKSLLLNLTESGEAEPGYDLVEVGHRAAERLGDAGLRSRLLALEGVIAARTGDADRASARWQERVAHNRRIGNPVGEADALLDLMLQAGDRGDEEAWRRWNAEAEDAVARAGRFNQAANLRIIRAEERLRAGDPLAAAAWAEEALGALGDSLGLDSGAYVRLGAAKIFARCGEVRQAVGAIAEVLEQALEASRPILVASSLTALGEIFRREEVLSLALRCLRTAHALYVEHGSRRAAYVEERLAEVRTLAPEPEEAESDPQTVARAILAELREGQTETVVA